MSTFFVYFLPNLNRVLIKIGEIVRTPIDSFDNFGKRFKLVL